MYHKFQNLSVIIFDNLNRRPIHRLFLSRTELPREKETNHMSSIQSMSLADRNFMSPTKLNKQNLTIFMTGGKSNVPVYVTEV